MSESRVDRSLLPWTSRAILHAQDVLERELKRLVGSGWYFERDALVDLPGGTVERMCFAGWHGGRRGVPDWICTVATPSSQAHDRVHNMRVLGVLGAGRYWIVDVTARTLECFRLSGDAHGEWIREAAYTAGELARVEAFYAFGLVLEVADLFLPPAAGPGGAP